MHLARAEEARDREDYDVAAQEAEKSRTLFENAGNTEGAVRARNLLGALESRRGNYKAAKASLTATLKTALETLGPTHPEVASSYYEIGYVHVAAGQTREGLELLEKALALRRAAGAEQTKEVSAILLRMALAHSAQGEDERALVLLEEAEAISRGLPGQPRLTDVLIGKGIALWGVGRYDQAIEALKQSVLILETGESGRRATLAAAYSNLGIVYWSKSDYDEALVYYEKALPLQVAARGEAHPDLGLVHYNLATIHLMRRDYDACIASSERALTILTPVYGERSSSVVQAYNTMGVALVRKGETDGGLKLLEKALAIQLALPSSGARESAIIHSSLAEAYRVKHDLGRAERGFRDALAIDLSVYGGRHPDVAEDYVNLGDLHLEKGDEAAALRLFARAIAANDPLPPKADPDLDPPFATAFSEEFLLRALKGAARARVGLGTKTADLRQVEAGARVYENASLLVERMRAGYRAEGSKLHVAESAAEIHDEAIRTELELHRLTGEERRLERAFRFSEKSKVGILRDALNEAAARSFSGIPGDVLARERRLRSDLAAADQRLIDAQLDGAEEGDLRRLRDAQFARKRDHDALQETLEKEYPAYYDLKYRFDTAGPAEIRERLLDERTVLVEYFLGSEQLSVFTITRQDIAVARVAREASLEAELEDLRRGIVGRDEAASTRAARRLYQMLLAPVASRITGRSLVIVPDGALSMLPFEALLKDDVAHDRLASGLPYVLRDHAVSYAYSATVALQGLNRRDAEPRYDFVGFAPSFASGAGPDAPVALPASREEVSDVRRLFAKRQGLFADWWNPRSRVYLGRDATEKRLKSPDVGYHRYVHLATHGIVDEERPGLTRLLLAPEPEAGEDGVLRLGETYDLRLNADLVVLSACDTARGKIAHGEGILGLTRGFLYAGADSLLVSLWPVADQASAALVVDFYNELLGGRPKAQALREAKLRALRRNPEYAKPYYWSALVLVGDRR